MRLSRSTGVGAGLLLVVLGLWAGLIPFVGPYFNYGFSPDATWHFTLNRLWLNILPAVAVVLGGLMLVGAVRRERGVFGGWLALLGGLWLIVGSSFSLLWLHSGPGVLQSGVGTPLGGHYRTAAEMIGVFYGVGGLITMIAAYALGRFMFAAPVAVGAAAAGATAGATAGPGRRAAAEEGDGLKGPGRPGEADRPEGAAGPEGPPAGPEEAAPRRRGLIRRRRGGRVERGEGVRPV